VLLLNVPVHGAGGLRPQIALLPIKFHGCDRVITDVATIADPATNPVNRVLSVNQLRHDSTGISFLTIIASIGKRVVMGGKKQKTENREIWRVSMPNELGQRAKLVAQSERRTLSSLLRCALEKYIEKKGD